MSIWDTVLENIHQHHPFLCTMRCSKEISGDGSALPSLVRMTAAGVLGLSQCPPASLLTVVVPRLYDTAFWVAFMVALEGMRGDYARAAAVPHSFKSGDILLLDSEHVVEFDEEKQGYLWFWTARSSNTRTCVKLTQRLRLQRTTTYKRLGGTSSVSVELPLNLLDSLLETQACGNRNIYRNTTILVSGMHRTEATARGLRVSSSASPSASGSAFDLVQWGKIEQGGELAVTSAGQREGDPVMLLASDLISVRDYLRAHPESRPLIVVDGTSRVCNRLDVLDDLAAVGASLAVCGERGARADLDLLADRSSDLWVWDREDLGDLSGPAPGQARRGDAFAGFNQAAFNFARRTVKVETCRDEKLEEAFQQLIQVDARLKQLDRDSSALKRTLFKFLLSASRALFPLLESDETEEMFAERMEAAVSAVSAAGEWDEDLAKVVEPLCLSLIDIPTRKDTHTGGKIAVLENLIRTSYPDTVTILTASAWEEEVVHNFLHRRRLLVTHGRVRVRSVSSLDVAQSGDMAVQSDRLIVCGWLNGEQMHRLYELCFSPNIHLLLYPFEENWFVTARRRWEKPIKGEMAREQKARLLNVSPENFPRPTPPPAASEPALFAEMDHEEFEQQIVRGLRDAATRMRPGDEAPASARLVFLSEGYLACLTETHRVRVVTHFVLGHGSDTDDVPAKTIDQLKPGDFVVFRTGTEGDIIRGYADLWLKKQGMGNLRDVAGLWRQALQEFRATNGGAGRDGLNRTAALLKAGGVARGEPTIKAWFDEDYGIIGPQDPRDLEAIARVTGSESLQKKMAQVQCAIREVRGAHHQASSHLIKRLMSELQNQMKTDSGAGRLDFEVEGLGKAVVLRVESVDQSPLFIPRNRVNRLIHEDNL